jgi:hypothetical protein
VNVFIVWNMNADSWNGTRTLYSIHTTIEGARRAIPGGNLDKYKQETMPDNRYVENYTYFAIEKTYVTE